MNLIIKQLLTPYNYTDRPTGSRQIKYIVWHYFGGLGTAQAVAQYFASRYLGASAHYAVDESDTVWQSVLDKDVAWHCGTSGRYDHPDCRNANSIGIEIRPGKIDRGSIQASDRDWYILPEAEAHAIELTRYLMKRYNIPADHVIRHYDVTHKYCPRPYLGDDVNAYYGTTGNAQWERIQAILNGKEELDMTKEELLSVAGTGDHPSEWAREATTRVKENGIVNGDGAGNYGWDRPVTREAQAVMMCNLEDHIMSEIKAYIDEKLKEYINKA